MNFGSAAGKTLLKLFIELTRIIRWQKTDVSFEISKYHQAYAPSRLEIDCGYLAFLGTFQ
jgi:hypothetical protein